MIVLDNPDNAIIGALLDAVLSLRPYDFPDIDRRAKKFMVVEKDDAENLIGGVYVYLHPGWAYIDLLWVQETQRKKGMGRRLMARAEDESRKRGSHSAYLWTQDFEAPEFYKKLGYQQVVTFENFIPGHRRYGFMKQLAA